MVLPSALPLNIFFSRRLRHCASVDSNDQTYTQRVLDILLVATINIMIFLHHFAIQVMQNMCTHSWFLGETGTASRFATDGHIHLCGSQRDVPSNISAHIQTLSTIRVHAYAHCNFSRWSRGMLSTAVEVMSTIRTSAMPAPATFLTPPYTDFPSPVGDTSTTGKHVIRIASGTKPPPLS